MPKSLKNISVVASATVVSRVLGLVREIFIAGAFGTSALASAFVSAFTLPNIFRRLLGEGALTAAFVPTMTDELEQQGRAGAFALLSRVATWLMLITTALVLIAIAAFANAGKILPLLPMETDDVSRLALGAELAIVLFPYMILVCVAASLSAACQVLGRFTEPAFSPAWQNLAVIIALGAAGWWTQNPETRMAVLCGAVLVGGFLQVSVPAVVLWREGWRPRIDFALDGRVREIARLMAPTLIGSAIYLVNIAVSRFIGLSLNPSAAALLNLSNRVMELPIGVFTAAIATVTFPLIARHAARQDWAALGADYQQGMRLMLLINLPAAAGLAVLSEPITRVLFQRGEFSASDTALMTPVLAAFALSLPFVSFTSLAIRGFYALKDTTTPVRAAAWSFVVNLVLSLVLMRWFSTVGLAVASSVAVVVQAVYLQAHLSRRRSELAFSSMWVSLGKIVAATVVMSAAVWGGARLVGEIQLPQEARDLIALLAIIPAACALYGALLWALRIEGRDALAALVARVLRRKRASGHAG